MKHDWGKLDNVDKLFSLKNVKRWVTIQIQFACNKGKGWVPCGEIVLSSTEGIVISITGLFDGSPLTASRYAMSTSSMLFKKARNQIKDRTVLMKSGSFWVRVVSLWHKCRMLVYSFTSNIYEMNTRIMTSSKCSPKIYKNIP